MALHTGLIWRADGGLALLERQVGRLLQKNSRAASRYSISIAEDEAVPAGLKLKWSARPEWDDWAAVSEGTYILRSNIHDWSDEELWKTYDQLSEAEAAFRIQKSDLCIRPVWHHKGVSKRTFLCAFSRMQCGRRCSNGSRAPASAMHHAPS